MNLRPVTATVRQELSKSWPSMLMGVVPAELDVFFIAWEDAASGDYVDYGVYLSTSEPGPLGANAFVVSSVTVPVPERTPDGVAGAAVAATRLLLDAVFLDPQYAQVRAKIREGADKSHKPTVEIVSAREFEQLMSRAAKD